MRITNTSGYHRTLHYYNVNGRQLGNGCVLTNADIHACFDPRLHRDIRQGSMAIEFEADELEIFDFLLKAHKAPTKVKPAPKTRTPAEIFEASKQAALETRKRMLEELNKPPVEGRPEFEGMVKDENAEPEPEARLIEEASKGVSLADLLRSNTVLKDDNGKT